MATFKFFNIGKANAEIERLEAELTKSQAETKAAKDNAAEVETAAEATSAELTKVRIDLKAAQDQVAAKDAEVAKVSAELKDAKEKLANPSAQVKEIASHKAAEITAAQGQPPVKVPAVENPAAPAKEKNNLSGFAKVQAAFKAQIAPQK